MKYFNSQANAYLPRE